MADQRAIPRHRQSVLGLYNSQMLDRRWFLPPCILHMLLRRKKWHPVSISHLSILHLCTSRLSSHFKRKLSSKTQNHKTKQLNDRGFCTSTQYRTLSGLAIDIFNYLWRFYWNITSAGSSLITGRANTSSGGVPNSERNKDVRNCWCR